VHYDGTGQGARTDMIKDWQTHWRKNMLQAAQKAITTKKYDKMTIVCCLGQGKKGCAEERELIDSVTGFYNDTMIGEWITGVSVDVEKWYIGADGFKGRFA
jgi:hypothetical protein